MRVQFHPQAQRELAEAARWYEQRRAGLGSELRRTVRDALRSWPRPRRMATLAESARGTSLLAEPLCLRAAGLPDEAHIAVLAVAHTSRRPGYQQARLRDL